MISLVYGIWLDHMSEKGMIILSKRGLFGGEHTGKLVFCDHCVFEKQKRVNFSIAKNHTSGIPDYIHSNLWGSSRVPSLPGKNYMLAFVDYFSRKV